MKLLDFKVKDYQYRRVGGKILVGSSQMTMLIHYQPAHT